MEPPSISYDFICCADPILARSLQSGFMQSPSPNAIVHSWQEWNTRLAGEPPTGRLELASSLLPTTPPEEIPILLATVEAMRHALVRSHEDADFAFDQLVNS